MCCLFGLIDYGKHLNAYEKSHMINILAKECEVRGTDATGIAYNSKKRLHIYKRPKPAHMLYFHIPSDTYVVMGHTRMTTQGSAKRNCNNHPFCGKAGGIKFALAHNGVLYNDHTLRHQLSLPRTRIQTDSYISVQLLEQKKSLNLESLNNMAEQVKGSFVFTVLDQKDQLYFIKGENPLCIYHYPQTGLFLYASTEEILMAALQKLHLILEDPEHISLSCGETCQISSNGTIIRSHFTLQQLYYRSSLWPSPLTLREFDSSYIRDLMDIAHAFGYTRQEVEQMLLDGLTPEEVEECFYYGIF